MADCEHQNEIVEVVRKESFQIVLNRDEARYLAALLGRTGTENNPLDGLYEFLDIHIGVDERPQLVGFPWENNEIRIINFRED